MQDFKKLDVWNLAVEASLSVYEVTGQFPREEVFGLSGQARRAAVSIAANIAEGVGRDSDAELLRFVRISLGSLNELETHMEIASRLGYVRPDDFGPIEDRLRDLGVRLRNLARRLEIDLDRSNAKQR